MRRSKVMYVLHDVKILPTAQFSPTLVYFFDEVSMADLRMPGSRTPGCMDGSDTSMHSRWPLGPELCGCPP